MSDRIALTLPQKMLLNHMNGSFGSLPLFGVQKMIYGAGNKKRRRPHKK